MMRSMFSAVSGLRAHQTRMDVIGNNIANVNTIGFKGSRVTFQEVFSQTLKGAGSPQDGKGGTNPHQVGLGINVSSMDTFHIRGAVERTDYNTDLMINGDGFFIVADGNNRSYTRAGNFALDTDGNLVTAEGYKVLGYMADENGVLKSTLEGLVISKATSFDAKVTENAWFEGNLNSETKRTSDYIPPPADIIQSTTTAPIPTSVYVQKTNANGKIYYEINPDFEDAVARETTFQVYDKLGGVHQIKQAYIKVEDVTVTGPPASTNSQYQIATFYVKADGTMHPASTAAADPLVSTPAIHSVQFNNNGKLVTGGTMSLQVNAALTNGAGAFTFDIDLSKLTMFANTSTASATKTDGYKQGTLEDFTIGPTGEIYGIFDNNQSKVLGQIALANFKNPAGLEKTGGNMYRVTSNSGQPIIGVPGGGGFGNLNPGAVEMSNVDLSREFTNMITTQRGFQANSRIITTSDEMLQEVVNMKR